MTVGQCNATPADFRKSFASIRMPPTNAMRPALVAVVAVERGLSTPARGLLRRCGFVSVECRSLEEAAAAIQRGPVPDYVVIMLNDVCRQTHAATATAALGPFLDAIGATLPPAHVVAVCSDRLQDSAQALADARGMRVLRTSKLSFRALSRFLLALQGEDGSRCCWSASEQRPQSRRRDVHVTRPQSTT
jgi:hypothetical protein